MKMNKHLKVFLAGMGIGLGSAIPGVSGGTIAVIFGVYEKIVWAVTNVFKHFKDSIKVLIPTLLGVILAIIPTVYLMDKALNNLLFAVICIFAGFIIGSLPGIKDEVKDVKFKKSHVIIVIVAALIAIGLGIGSVLAKADVTGYIYNTPVWFYFILIVVGFVASVALVVPGLSGSMILLLLGFYKPLINMTTETVKTCLNGDWSGFGHLVLVLGVFAIGVILGFYFISKLMHFLLAKYHDLTFMAIIGFVVGSVFALFFNFEIYEYYMLWANGLNGYLKYYIEIPLGIALLIITLILSYQLVRYQRKVNAIEKEEVPE